MKTILTLIYQCVPIIMIVIYVEKKINLSKEDYDFLSDDVIIIHDKYMKWQQEIRNLPCEHAADAGNLPATYFTKLDAFFKPKQNTMMAIKEVWTNFQQGNEELNSWIARISNAIQLADYHDLPEDMNIKDRLVRDILLAGRNSQKAKSRIMKEGAGVLLPAAINILQEEKQATQYKAKSVHYVKYDAKKGKNGQEATRKEASRVFQFQFQFQRQEMLQMW